MAESGNREQIKKLLTDYLEELDFLREDPIASECAQKIRTVIRVALPESIDDVYALIDAMQNQIDGCTTDSRVMSDPIGCE